MLLIDGVKYELWTPQKEVEEFHPLVKEHYRDIFGKNSIFIEGNRLESESGKGSVPDGFVVTLGEVPKWHIVEMELSTHQLYDHIVNQVGRFINGVKNTATQKKIIEAIHHHIQENKQRKAEFEEAIGSGEIYKLLTDVISKSPVLTIIIEKRTRELDEAIDLLKYSPIKIVEFQTFTSKVSDKPTHVHMFEPLTPAPGTLPDKPRTPSKLLSEIRKAFIRIRPSLKPHRPTERYCYMSLGHRRIHLEWLLWEEQKGLGVELHFERTSHTENALLLEKLKAREAELKKSIGESLVFEPLWGRRFSRVYVMKEIEEPPDFKRWAVETMVKFYDVAKPILDEIDVT